MRIMVPLNINQRAQEVGDSRETNSFVPTSGRMYERQKKKPCTGLLLEVEFAPPPWTVEDKKINASPKLISADTASSVFGRLEWSHMWEPGMNLMATKQVLSARVIMPAKDLINVPE